MTAHEQAEKARADYLRKIKATRKARTQLIQARKEGRSRFVVSRRKRIYERSKKRRAKAHRVFLRWKAKANNPLRLRALHEATRLVGIMESGGNNVGADVEKIIKEGGGIRGQAWCGWLCATVYKRAGSKAVTWQWGAVRLLSAVTGVKRTTDPEPGDLVRFTFDHVGIFVKRVNGNTIQTIEGNTGASGAVSDSKTGGDGVYRKNRSTSLVRDYLRVTR